jgi:uncharacterized NAD-dependent epimerase/dehydratase family protein
VRRRLKVPELPRPYLVFLGDERDPVDAKTGFGLRDWAGGDCVAQWRMDADTVSLELPDMRPAEAKAAGARSLVVGIAPVGGQIPEAWVPFLVEALEAGLDLVSGLHTRLREVPAVAEAAEQAGRSLFDVRHGGRRYPAATGRRRSGKRLLTVGTDCALGKKYTALALVRAMRARGMDAEFRATGQTGIMIAGEGIAIDSVVADFVAGAAEALTPDSAPGHWDVIEGQGAIFHPAYAGVTLGLLHGSQPDALVLCHDPRRSEISSFPGFPIRPLGETIAVYETLARVTNPEARTVAISINTGTMDEAAAREEAARLAGEHGLPCFDPLRFGIEQAVAAL